MTRTLLTLGHGYTARALVRHLRRQDPDGWRFLGTTRSADDAHGLATERIDVQVWPGSDLTDAISRATHILLSAAPTENGDPFLSEVADYLRKSDPQSRASWIGYLSTTGVYGDHQGGWVDESTPLTPTTQRGRHRVVAEGQWRALSEEFGLPLHIFRLAGIYGAGRGPFAKVRAGTARRIVKPGQVFSRIHVDDIVQVLAASIAQPSPGAVYNVCDDDPAPPQDVIAHAADLLGLPLPEEIDYDTAQMTPMARSFYAESKRVRNDRIKADLGVRLLYPTYRDGLASVQAEERDL